MGQTAQRCCGLGEVTATDASTATEEKNHLLTEFRNKKNKSGNIINKSICNKLEELIQSDPSNRGIKNLHIPGELYKATLTVCNAKHIIIMTGFPCCAKAPYTENDGPAGTMLLAYSLLKHNINRKVTIMIDPIHKSSMEPLIKYFNGNSRLKNKNPLKLYVLDNDKFDFEHDFIESDRFIDVDCMIAIELAGTTMDGTFRTMSGKDISDKCGQCALLFDYINKNRNIEITTIGIGDGGNECGMGKVNDKVTKYVSSGKTIACNINADYLITAGVSNWGAEALSIGLGTFADNKFHANIYAKCNEFGMADGITQKIDGTVDGLSYTQHSKMYGNLCAVYKKKQGNQIIVDDNDENEDKSDDEEEYLPLPGKCMIKRTFDLQKDLLALKEKYNGKYKELLPREWKIIDKNKYENGGDDIVKIMQFNMLADGLSCAYSNIETEKSFIGVDKECLQWTHRGLRICEEITRFGPDIVCIQECDQIQFLMQYLARFGYDFYAQNSGDTIQKVAKKLSQERGTEIKMPDCNVVILVKSKRFDVIDTDDKFIQKIDKTKNEANVVGLVVPLRFKQNNKEFIMVTTHLKSKKTEDGEKIRKKQINLLLKKLISNDDNLPLILCCDLNGNPIKNKNGYDPLCYDSIVDKNNGIGYKSIYRLISDDNNEPDYTTWKYRKHGTDKHCIDYIFVNDENKFNILATLEIPNVNENELDNIKALIPNWNYPSDHFSLMAQLTFK